MVGRLTPKIVFIIAGLLVGLLIVVGYGIAPALTRFIQNNIIQLVPGHFIRNRYLEFTLRIYFKVYLFNITNAEGVLRGEKPVLQEVGPYFFEEKKSKLDHIDNKKDDTLEFTLRNRITFLPEMSEPLTGKEVLTVPNYMFVLTLLYGAREIPEQLGLIMNGIDIVFRDSQSMFTQFSAEDLLWKGIDVDCTNTSFPAKIICSNMGSRPLFEKLDNRHLLFTWGSIRNTKVARFKVQRGQRNIQDVNRVIEFKEMPIQRVWSSEECNRLEGTDSLLFPPEMKKGQVVKAFVADACRAMHLVPSQKTGRYHTLKYVQHVGFFTNLNSSGQLIPCFCRRHPNDCPVEGVWDLSPCQEAPIAISKPHFLGVDPSVQKKVAGLSPDPDKHELYVNFNYFVGVPVESRVRVQLNLIMHPVPEHPVGKDFPTLLMPILWFEENVNVTGDILAVTKLSEYSRFGYLLFRKIMMVLIPPVVAFGFYLRHTAASSQITVAPVQLMDKVIKSQEIENGDEAERDKEKGSGVKIVSEIMNEIRDKVLEQVN